MKSVGLTYKDRHGWTARIRQGKATFTYGPCTTKLGSRAAAQSFADLLKWLEKRI